jgi:hypothetical protein
MTQQIINVGASANDGLGDPLRTAFTKCNNNFDQLFAYQLPVYTAANLIITTGAVGKIASVSNSPTSGGRLAFWDTTNSRWSYVSDNTAV